MEGDTQLLHVIREMHSEISKLEKENKELRGELSLTGHKTVNAKEREVRPRITCELQQSEEVTCKGVLRRNVSAGANDIMQEQTGAKMTVRRYSMSSLVSGVGYYKHNAHIKRHSSSGTLKINGPIQATESDVGNQQAINKETAEELPPELLANNIPKSRSFQEYMHKCRGRVKVVTFLLPMDMRAYAENQKTFQNPENQRANHLSTIIEKDP
ncbi:putative coiled-coil domain-containing protein 195 [Aquarana catesbeiana]|uniref:putative coiled-coil domain-containing protein 195 n=1 Tax=Aquarana catesbeiana TaxID=8400 RepID=UPI003CC9332E